LSHLFGFRTFLGSKKIGTIITLLKVKNMYKTTNEGLPTPTANLAINRSRIKIYGKNSEVPTYYLQKGQEFQIELFNPTKDTIMAKISLNGKPIAQGGLVLKPAQRVFLDRYIDVARKFKFDTYEVANTSESIAAIEDNGDFKVEFYKEHTPQSFPNNYFIGKPIYCNTSRGFVGGVNTNNTTLGFNGQNTTFTNNVNGVVGTSNYSTDIGNSNKIGATHNGGATLDWMEQEQSKNITPELKTLNNILRSRSVHAKKSIETGRVEAGSSSDQTLQTVYMNWEYLPFHSIEYKMLPLSQKINTVEDTQVKRYCTNCGGKNKPNFKFCPVCGTQV